VPNPANPQDWNRFSYVRNNPINFIDPSGHVICNDEGVCFTPPPNTGIGKSATPTPIPTPTGQSNSTEEAIDMMQLSPLGQVLYEIAIMGGLKIEYNDKANDCSGGLKGKTILMSPCYTSIYNAGTIAHETFHYHFQKRGDKDGSLYQEYAALLVGDVVRAQIIQAGHGSIADMRHPISDYTVDLNNSDLNKLAYNLYQWFMKDETERVYIEKYNLEPLPEWMLK
jgi:hypothetical protein